MTSFALLFMIVSMTAVTTLAGYCIYRVLTSEQSDDDPNEGA